MKIKTFGPVDERSLEQLKRCMEAGEAEYGVLCADHHPGYSQPIGGGIAYEGYVSPSGVGFDIGCLAAGTRVGTMDGFVRPIEAVTPAHAVSCLDRGRLRRVDPSYGRIARGTKPVRDLLLANGRRLALTEDHRVVTRHGWREARSLVEGDAVLCVPLVGPTYEPYVYEPALLRILGYVCGDGHLIIDWKSF